MDVKIVQRTKRNIVPGSLWVPRIDCSSRYPLVIVERGLDPEKVKVICISDGQKMTVITVMDVKDLFAHYERVQKATFEY